MKYKSKPATCEAVQLNWKNWNEVCDFTGKTISPENPAREIGESAVSSTCGERGPTFIEFDVITIHGDKATVRHGDYIVREPDRTDRFYPVKPDVFEKRWEPMLMGGEPMREIGDQRAKK